MLGAWAGHVVAALDAPPELAGRPLTMRQVPLAVVMVALTTLTLWSLGQAIVVTPPASGRSERGSGSGGRDQPRLTGLRDPLPERPDGRHGARRSPGRAPRRPRRPSRSRSRHRIPSAVAAWRISAASRTAPDRGVGVLTTRRTSPLGDEIEDRRPRRSTRRPPRRAWLPAARRSRPRPARVASPAWPRAGNRPRRGRPQGVRACLCPDRRSTAGPVRPPPPAAAG